MKIALNDVKICDPSSDHHLKKANVLVKDGVIDYIGKESKRADRVIEGKGMWLSTGWCDLWTFTGDPGHENKEDLHSVAEAAARGGFTAVCPLPNNDPVTSTKNDIRYYLSGNEDRVTEFLPLGAVTKQTAGEELTEMIDLFESGAVAFTDGLHPLENSELVVKTLQYLQKTGAVLLQRAKDQSLAGNAGMHEGTASTELGLRGVPSLAEEVVVQRDISLQEYAGGRLHFVNVSTAGALSLIRKAVKKEEGISASTPAYQALFTDEDIPGFDTYYKVDPPFRSNRDNSAIISALRDDVIEVLTSNHMPQDTESKKLEFDLADFGMISLQTVAHCLVQLSKKLPLEQLLFKVSTAPRRVLGVEVPSIAKGEKANLTLLDPKAKWTLNESSNASKSQNSPFFGKELTGKVAATIRGERHWIDG